MDIYVSHEADDSGSITNLPNFCLSFKCEMNFFQCKLSKEMNTLGPMKSRLLQPVTSVELENMQLSAKRVKTRQVTTVFTSDWLKNSEHTSQNH